MKRKNIVSLVAFILCAGIMICALSHLFRDKESSFDNYYLEPEDTIDALFVGSSHIYTGVCPAVLWQDYGVSAYNVYAWNMPAWTGYYYLLEALKTQSPDVVFFEASSIIMHGGIGGPHEKDAENREQNMWFASGKERLLLTIESISRDSEVFDLGLFHNKWKNPEMIEWTHKANTDNASLRNFGPKFNEYEYELFNYSFFEDVTPPTENVMKYLEKLVALSEEDGFRLVFTLTPYASNEQQNAVNNWLHTFCQQNGYDYIDFMQAPGIDCDFDYRYDMADADHVNVSGAIKISHYFGEYLRSIGLADQRDNPNAEQLDKDAAATFRVFEYTGLFTDALTAESYAKWLSESSGYKAALVFPEAESSAFSLFADAFGIDSPEGCTAFIDGGALTELSSTETGALDLSHMGGSAEIGDGTIVTRIENGAELLTSSRDDLLIILYDDAMERLVFAVTVAPNGTLSVYENTSTIRGAK